MGLWGVQGLWGAAAGGPERAWVCGVKLGFCLAVKLQGLGFLSTVRAFYFKLEEATSPIGSV